MEDLTIVNLTSRKLTKIEEATLKKGLASCPTQGFEYTQTRKDLYLSIRKLKLHKFFKIKGLNRREQAAPTTAAITTPTDILPGDDLETLLLLECQYESNDTGEGVGNISNI